MSCLLQVQWNKPPVFWNKFMLLIFCFCTNFTLKRSTDWGECAARRTLRVSKALYFPTLEEQNQSNAVIWFIAACLLIKSSLGNSQSNCFRFEDDSKPRCLLSVCYSLPNNRSSKTLSLCFECIIFFHWDVTFFFVCVCAFFSPEVLKSFALS